MPTNKPLTYSVTEVAAMLGISRASAYQAANNGQIPVVRIGRRFVVPRAAFDQFLQHPQAGAAAAG